MEQIMIDINRATMDFRLEHDSTNSLKEFVVKLVKGKLKYDRFRAVDNVTAQIKKGEVCGIIGRNGAGKSTLLKMIAGVLTPTDGSIRIHGKIAPMLELGAGFDQDLTARENIYLNGAILGYSREFIKQRFDHIVEFAELQDFIEQPVRTYSSGMLMRLAFSIATQVDPEILIVDEILSVGDLAFQAKSEEKMLQMIGGGTTVLYVSHSTASIRSLCSRVIWLEHGRMQAIGAADEICTRYENHALPCLRPGAAI